jgi:integrase
MARKINLLNARNVATITEPGRHSDGGNLYLNVTKTGARSWIFMYRLHGKTRELGLGSAHDVSLKRARELAAAHRSKLAEGVEPTAKRDGAGNVTFGKVADQKIEDMRPGWRSAKHAKQWEDSLKVDAAALRNMPVDGVDTEAVLRVLRPIWTTKSETASRLRSRIELVLDAAKAKGLRSGENPARWRGHLDQLLPKRQRLEKAHHPAMAYSDVPEFMEKLRAMEGTTARALEFCILTAARSGEVLGARREEIDFEAGLWTVPASRMKGGREHVVPLSKRAIEIVRGMPEGEFVFAGRFKGTRLSDMVLFHMLRRQMGVDGVTVHGFRSSFRDWCGDCTHTAREVVEAALAHAVGNATEAAYRRSTALEKRRDLMKAWDTYCGTPPAANVIQFKSA